MIPWSRRTRLTLLAAWIAITAIAISLYPALRIPAAAGLFAMVVIVLTNRDLALIFLVFSFEAAANASIRLRAGVFEPMDGFQAVAYFAIYLIAWRMMRQRPPELAPKRDN
jgi:hypothetical protein